MLRSLPQDKIEIAMAHLSYEVSMCAVSAARMLSAEDGYEHNAYLECMLLHARALDEFLVMTRDKPYKDNMLRTDFGDEWEPHPIEAVQRLKERRSLINKHLAHLTWARVDSAEAPQWSFIEIANDIVSVAGAWVQHVTALDDQDDDDPDIKALALWNAVKDAKQVLAGVAGP